MNRLGAKSARAFYCFSFVLRFTLSISGEIIVLCRTLSARAAEISSLKTLVESKTAHSLFVSLACLEEQRKNFLLCLATQILRWGATFFASVRQGPQSPDTAFYSSTGARMPPGLPASHSGSQAET